MDKRTAAKVKFIAWAKRRYPRLHAEAVRAHAPRSGLGDVTATDTPAAAQTGMLDNIVNTIGKLGTAYAQYKSQSQIIDLNVQRAKAGLPPIDAGDIAPQANVGIAASTRTMMYAGIGALVLVGVLMAASRR
jgi:hypothetical protein